jgi:GTPase SAR1 family protein
MVIMNEKIHPIFLLIGPPAVGKSTTSHALSAHFPKSIHIPVDDLRHMVVNGLELPGAFWSDELTEQVSLARHTVTQMAVDYRIAGFVVVIDDFWDQNLLTNYQKLFYQPEVYKIILLPDQDIALQRNLMRSNNETAVEYINEGIRIVYQQLNTALSMLVTEGWQIIDTTNLDIDDTVTTLLKQITP